MYLAAAVIAIWWFDDPVGGERLVELLLHAPHVFLLRDHGEEDEESLIC